MYVVDLVFGILVSWMSRMCELSCILLMSFWMPGRLELMHPVFHVIMFKAWVGGCCGLGWLIMASLFCDGCMAWW